MRDRESETGAALLTVLLLVAVLAVIAALALDRLTLATRTAQNVATAEQARALLAGAEQLVALRLGDAAAAGGGSLSPRAAQLAVPYRLAVPGGTVTAQVRDVDNCFNLNSLVRKGEGPESYVARPAAAAQFLALMRLLGVPGQTAVHIAAATTDWLDSDGFALPGGAEDATYLARSTPYRTGGGPMADVSELLAVDGMTSAIYRQLRPWLCALPEVEPTRINLNTLLPSQALLLAALTEGRLSEPVARQLLAHRPADGYASSGAFWSQPALAGLGIPQAQQGMAALTSRWFEVDLKAELGGTEITETVLFDALDRPARLVRRRWGEDG